MVPPGTSPLGTGHWAAAVYSTGWLVGCREPFEVLSINVGRRLLANIVQVSVYSCGLNGSPARSRTGEAEKPCELLL